MFVRRETSSWFWGRKWKDLALHHRPLPLAHGAALCTSLSATCASFYQQRQHCGGNLSSSSLLVCLASSTQMKLEGKIRRLLGDEFQEKVLLFSQLFHCSLIQCPHSTGCRLGRVPVVNLVNKFFHLLRSCKIWKPITSTAFVRHAQLLCALLDRLPPPSWTVGAVPFATWGQHLPAAGQPEPL